jgi:hypothetical protein
MNKRLAFAGLCAGALCACSNGSTGPSYPPIQGTYAASFSLTFDNGAQTQNGTLVIPGTIVIGRPARDGSFIGSYVYSGGATGSGTISGQIDMQGGVTIFEFGDPNQPPIFDSQFLNATWPNCDFSQATGNGMSGSLVPNSLSLLGSLDFPCTYTNGNQTVQFPTTLTEQVTANQ